MKKVAFILDGFELQSPGQQLLDRFLMGWSENGAFRSGAGKVVLWMSSGGESPLVQRRVKEFGLELASSLETAVAEANLTIIAPGTTKLPQTDPGTVLRWLNSLPKGATFYIDASLLLNIEPAATARICHERPLKFLTSRAAAHFLPLPADPSIPPKGIEKVLLVAHGNFPDAELDSLYALAPFVSLEPTVGVNRLSSSEVLDLMHRPEWKPLLAAAVSRSDTIKGDPEKDGRTQDIVGLQLIEKLATNPRGWRLQNSGMEIVILVLNGVLADFNLAAAAPGRIYSAQVYRPPTPAQEHYSGLASWILERAGDDAPGNFAETAIRQLLINWMEKNRGAD
jgi:hypothetical protein